MTIKELKVQRFSVTSSKVFHDIVAVIEAAVGRPDMREFARNLRAANTMELTRMDLGEVLRKRDGTGRR
jgi:hypothetical protein